MKRHTLPTMLVPITLALAAGMAAGACLPVAGTVKLQRDRSCNVMARISGPIFTGECFSVQLSLLGFPQATGFAGLTSEALLGANGVATTPAVIPDTATQLPRQIVQTARSVVAMGSGSRRTTLYSSDVILMQPVIGAGGQVSLGAVTEQILITGSDGQGAYAKVTGYLSVVGNSIGESAPVAGKLCLP